MYVYVCMVMSTCMQQVLEKIAVFVKARISVTLSCMSEAGGDMHQAAVDCAKALQELGGSVCVHERTSSCIMHRVFEYWSQGKGLQHRGWVGQDAHQAPELG